MNMKRSSSIDSFESDNVIVNTEEKSLQSFVKQMLQTKIFLGQYQEKRYVNSLNMYRDVILISKIEETFIENLEIVRKRLYNFYLNDVWIGITLPDNIGTPAGHCLWVELNSELTLGEYWFVVKKIKFRHNEIILKLKAIRPKLKEDTIPKSTLQKQDTKMSGEMDFPFTTEEVIKGLKEIFVTNIYSLIEAFITNLKNFYKDVLTRENILETFKAICILTVTLITGSFHVIRYTGDFVIKFMREFSNIIHVSTPFMIEVLHFFQKIIGGIFILIAMIFRDSKAQYNITYGNDNYQRALPPPPPPHRNKNQYQRSQSWKHID